MFLDKFSIAGTIFKTRADLVNIKQREGKSLMSYLERFKKMYDEIEGISQDMVIAYFECGFRSRMLYTELELRKPETISEMFNVACKVALVEGSTHESIFKKKERYLKASPHERREPDRWRHSLC